MSDDLVLANKDAATVIAEALARYKQETVSEDNPNGTTLAPADPRRLHLQALLLLLTQMRALIDFAGKQSLLRYVGDEFVDELIALWGEERIPAAPSKTTERFNFGTSAAHTVAAGVRVTDGINIWTVTEDASNTGTFVDAAVECTITGKATNGVAPGQIDTLVDPTLVPGCTSVANTTETISGRNTETLAEVIERMRDVPEANSTCGPRTAYQEQALGASASVADAVALGPDDEEQMAGSPPGPCEVFVYLLEGTRDDDGVLTEVVPEPSGGLLTSVDEALSAEDVRPLTDRVTVKAPTFIDFDAIATYYIPRSRAKQATQIQAAVVLAWNAWLLWQQSKIGRDINPDEGTKLVVAAGAKRLVFTSPSFTALSRDESARAYAVQLVYGGIEDD